MFNQCLNYMKKHQPYRSKHLHQNDPGILTKSFLVAKTGSHNFGALIVLIKVFAVTRLILKKKPQGGFLFKCKRNMHLSKNISVQLKVHGVCYFF